MQSKEGQLFSDNIIKTIVLEEGGIELDGVEIVEMPVSIKGDTIVYNADPLKQDRKEVTFEKITWSRSKCRWRN
jgi:hypothetical protein